MYIQLCSSNVMVTHFVVGIFKPQELTQGFGWEDEGLGEGIAAILLHHGLEGIHIRGVEYNVMETVIILF